MFFESGFNDLDQLLTITTKDLAELCNDVGLTMKRGHQKRFYAGIENLSAEYKRRKIIYKP